MVAFCCPVAWCVLILTQGRVCLPSRDEGLAPLSAAATVLHRVPCLDRGERRLIRHARMRSAERSQHDPYKHAAVRGARNVPSPPLSAFAHPESAVWLAERAHAPGRRRRRAYPVQPYPCGGASRPQAREGRQLRLSRIEPTRNTSLRLNQ